MAIQTPLSTVNRTDRIIASITWRNFLGNPSDPTWAIYRKYLKLEARNLTQYEALVLWALRHWRVICADLNIRFNLPKNIFTLERTLNEWFIFKQVEGMPADRMVDLSYLEGALTHIATLNDVSGRDLLGLVVVLRGKSISISTLKRVCALPYVPKFSLVKKYTTRQVAQIVNALDKQTK